MSLSDDDDDYLSADEDCLMAPPPTPALSSSFNSDEHTSWSPQTITSPNLKTNTTQDITTISPRLISETLDKKNTASTSNPPELTKAPTSTSANKPTIITDTINTTTNSQYGWRIPSTKSKVKQQQQQSAVAIIKDESKEACQTEDNPMSEQTRLTLDRLSEKLSHYEKNIFEQVAEDIKKVSIKPKEPNRDEQSGVISESVQEDDLLSSGNIPIISDLGNTLGWGATKLFASASQVKSQVAPLLDSVVNVPQNLLQQHQKFLYDDGHKSVLKKQDSLSMKNDNRKDMSKKVSIVEEPKEPAKQKEIEKSELSNSDPKIDEDNEQIINIETISNTLGNTLGWGWSGASKLFASASSQVTSQVGSVLDSVVNSQHQQQVICDSSIQKEPYKRVEFESQLEIKEKDLEKKFSSYSKEGDNMETIKSIKNLRKQTTSERNDL